MRRCLIPILLLLFVIATSAQAAKLAPVHVLHVEGQIDPAVAGYIKDGIENAVDDGAQAVLVVLDTPGGSINTMQDIVKAFFASELPIIVYVAPDGATAGSAGTLITMAADIAAMAPASNIGSASPVSGTPGEEGKEMPSTMKKKVFNFMAKYARSVAEKRGRNGDWAEKAVREAANLTSKDALKNNVIDYVAKSVPDLMRQVDGRKVELSTGKTVTLHTARAPLKDVPMGAWDTFLHYLSAPMVALFLTMAAMYGIIYELANPGSIFPGVVGAISIILLLYSFSVIPVNAAGFAFIMLAILLFVVDLFAPTHGVLSVGGVVSMFFGLMMLFRASEGFMVSYWVLGAVALLTGGFFVFIISLGVRAMRNPYVSSKEGVVGHVGEARTDLNPTGKVFVDGSLWTATSEGGTITAGEKVEVTEMTGLRLRVRKLW